MSQSKILTFLNMGTENRKAFLEGIGNTPYRWYHTKRMMLHIKNGVPTFLYRGKPIDWANSHVFTRLRGTDQLFCGMLYEYFLHHGIPVNDPIGLSYEQSAEKIAQMLKLTLAGIRVPETIVFREEAYYANRRYLEATLSFPLIFKTDGSRGKNVHFVIDKDTLESCIKEKRPHERALVQPFIENTFDTRTLIAYGEIIGTIKRARTQGYLNNIAQGAIPSVFTLTENERVVALKAAEACGIDIAGVDMIHTENGPVVLEVNKGPQVAGFELAHNMSVYARIGEILKQKIENGLQK